MTCNLEVWWTHLALVVRHQHHLVVPGAATAHLLVGGVLQRAARVAHGGGVHARQPPEALLRPPEAPAVEREQREGGVVNKWGLLQSDKPVGDAVKCQAERGTPGFTAPPNKQRCRGGGGCRLRRRRRRRTVPSPSDERCVGWLRGGQVAVATSDSLRARQLTLCQTPPS